VAEFSNPLQRGLKKMDAPGEVHPDADLLTAFAEQSLTKREHENVLAHLASCADCRDIVALALPETPASAPAAEPVKPLFWRWPVLRWGAVAASVVIVVVAVSIGNMERHQREKQSPQVVAELRPAPVPEKTPAMTPSASSKVQEPLPQLGGTSGVQRPKVRYERIPSDSQVSGLPSLTQPAAPAPGKERSDSGTAGASDQQSANLAVGKIVADVAEAKAQPLPSRDEHNTAFKPEAGIYAANSRMKPVVPPGPPPPPSSNATEAVEVTSEAVTVASAKTAPPGGLLLEADKTDSKLGAATQSYHGEGTMAKKQLMRFAAATNWRISNGLLQRSFDSGQTWEQARPDANFRAVSTIGNDIWAGGANGLLVHSADAGQNWSAVSPGITGDVSSLHFTDARHGSVKTTTGETWSTADAGKSWKKE
jgi:hypothetical protein